MALHGQVWTWYGMAMRDHVIKVLVNQDELRTLRDRCGREPLGAFCRRILLEPPTFEGIKRNNYGKDSGQRSASIADVPREEIRESLKRPLLETTPRIKTDPAKVPGVKRGKHFSDTW